MKPSKITILRILFSTVASLVLAVVFLYHQGYTFNYFYSQMMQGDEVFEGAWTDNYNDQQTAGSNTYVPGSRLTHIRPGLFATISKINTDGFVDRDFEYKPNTCNIAVVGDSYVAAHQVNIDKKFYRLLEGMLAPQSKSVGIDIKVHGIGMDGTSVIHQIELLKPILAKYGSPDYYIFTHASNDFRDSYVITDWANFNTIGLEPDGSFAHFRTTVAKSADGNFYVIHPKKNSTYAGTPILEPKPDQFYSRGFILALNKLAEDGYASVDWDRPHTPENIPTPDNMWNQAHLPPVYKDAVDAHTFAVDEFFKMSGVSSGKVGVFLSHGAVPWYDTGTMPGYLPDQFGDYITAPWKKYDADIVSNKTYAVAHKLSHTDYQIVGDGHLNVEGHEHVARQLAEELGPKIALVCADKANGT